MNKLQQYISKAYENLRKAVSDCGYCETVRCDEHDQICKLLRLGRLSDLSIFPYYDSKSKISQLQQELNEWVGSQ